MQQGRASRTALGVAVRRATHQVLDRPLVFEDPLALRIAGCDEQGIREAHELGKTSPPMRAFMAVRSRFAEDELARAVGCGVDQYVVLGAGLDTFGCRNPWSGVRVFEVDHPDTQAWKKECLDRTGIVVPPTLTFAPVDFESQTLREGLARVDFQFDRPAWFSWLGVVPYLTIEAFRATAGLIGSMPEGSGVVFDYSPPRSELNMMQRFALERLSRRVAAAGEPFRLFFKPAELADELAAAGFHRLEDLGAEALNQRYFANREDGLRLWGGARIVSARVGISAECDTGFLA
jgi:methyltransferase (TIGR00027 family)